MVLRKHELEAKLKDDLELVRSGVLRDENPLDSSEEFNELLEACRRGDLKRTQELISAGVNLNGKDKFDYTPLIIVRLGLRRPRFHVAVHITLEVADPGDRRVYVAIMSWLGCYSNLEPWQSAIHFKARGAFTMH
jgi:hypothetical protein